MNDTSTLTITDTGHTRLAALVPTKVARHYDVPHRIAQGMDQSPAAPRETGHPVASDDGIEFLGQHRRVLRTDGAAFMRAL
ncbi:hypothetical protein [Nocardia sp. NPDC004260]